MPVPVISVNSFLSVRFSCRKKSCAPNSPPKLGSQIMLNPCPFQERLAIFSAGGPLAPEGAQQSENIDGCGRPRAAIPRYAESKGKVGFDSHLARHEPEAASRKETRLLRRATAAPAEHMQLKSVRNLRLPPEGSGGCRITPLRDRARPRSPPGPGRACRRRSRRCCGPRPRSCGSRIRSTGPRYAG